MTSVIPNVGVPSRRTAFGSVAACLAGAIVLMQSASPERAIGGDSIGHMDVVPGPVHVYYKPLTDECSTETNTPPVAIAPVREIEPCDGGAVARFGPHEVNFPLLSSDPVSIRTPEGKMLYCRPVLLVFRDRDDKAVALEARPAKGEISSGNTVIYPDVWPCGSVTYEYSARSLIQDVVFEKLPEFPKGFEPVRVEVWTAWGGDEPVRKMSRRITLRQDSAETVEADDEFVDFGHMRLVGDGAAFTRDRKEDRVPVAKSWAKVEDGISWLVESVDFPGVEPMLSRLPKVRLQASVNPVPAKTLLASVPRLSAPGAVGTVAGKAMQTASIELSTKERMMTAANSRSFAGNAFVLDFTLANGMTIPDGVRAWWSADNSEADGSGNGHTAAIYNGVAYGTGKVANGWSMSGSEQHGRVPYATDLLCPTGLTVTCWIKPTQSNAWANLVTKWDAVSGLNQKSWASGLYPDNRVYFGASPYGTDSGCVSALSTNALPLNVWSHVVGTYDGQYVSIYVNGILENQAVYSSGVFGGNTDVGLGACVGGLTAGDASYCFTGAFDEAGIYARALSPTEVSALYQAAGLVNAVCVNSQPAVVGWWTADNTWGDLVNGNTAVPYGGATFSTSGRVSQSFSFDGVDDYAEVASTAALNPTNALTVEAWVYRTGNQYQNLALISKDGCTSERQYFLTISSYNKFRAHVGTTGGLCYFDGATTVQLNTWYHVAMTYDGSALRLYVNGILDGSQTATGTLVTTTQPVRIGGSTSGGWGNYKFAGFIDEPAIYNLALSQSSIQGIVAAGPAGKCRPFDPDSDDDGLPDNWETLLFGGLNQTASGDYDGDGLSNYQEYRMSMNPKLAAAADPGLINLQVYVPAR